MIERIRALAKKALAHSRTDREVSEIADDMRSQRLSLLPNSLIADEGEWKDKRTAWHRGVRRLLRAGVPGDTIRSVWEWGLDQGYRLESPLSLSQRWDEIYAGWAHENRWPQRDNRREEIREARERVAKLRELLNWANNGFGQPLPEAASYASQLKEAKRLLRDLEQQA